MKPSQASYAQAPPSALHQGKYNGPSTRATAGMAWPRYRKFAPSPNGSWTGSRPSGITICCCAGTSRRSNTDKAPAFRTRDAVLNAAHRDLPHLQE